MPSETMPDPVATDPVPDESEDTLTCAECGGTDDVCEDYQSADGETICKSCYWESHFACDDCRSAFPDEDESPEPGLCQSCYDDSHTTCDDCNRTVPSDDTSYIESSQRTICERCYDRHYFTCDACNEIVHCDDYHGDGYCEDCAPPDDDDDDDRIDRELIHNHGCGHAARLGPFGKGPIRFGIELEIEVHQGGRADRAASVYSAIGRDFVSIEEDSSIDQTPGFEIVSAPADLETHRDRWPKLLGTAATKGCKSWDTKTCGMHVHVSRRPLTPLTIGKLLVFLNDRENRSFLASVAGRSDTQWCRSYVKKLTDARATDGDRYQALNLTNYATIEFRIFKGTLNLDSFLKNLEFVAAVVAWTKHASCQDLRYKSFLAWVGKAPKLYPYLSKWLRAKGYLTAPSPKPNTVGALPCPDPESDLP